MKLKEDLIELQKMNENVRNELNHIKNNSEEKVNDINAVKILKNNIYERASKVFTYNLKRLIQLESTQKKLARKIGVSEDLLSKYKSGEAFPSIETLIYICEIYNISMESLLSTPLSISEIDTFANVTKAELNMFEKKYYVYFLVTNIDKEGALHEGSIEFNNDTVTFSILSAGQLIKSFTGRYSFSDRLVFFELSSKNDGIAYISMIRPNLSKKKYVGGLSLLMLPSDAASKPCVQKILFSKIRLDRKLYRTKIKDLLYFSLNEHSLGHVKISQGEDELAYDFISNLVNLNETPLHI